MHAQYQNYDYWTKNASRYDIRKVLQFCGNEQYIQQAALAIPKFGLGMEVQDPLKKAVVEQMFADKFDQLPELYQNAILRNHNVSDDFFNKILKKINWYVFVENPKVSFDFFRNNPTKLHPKWCRNPNMRRDVFNLLNGEQAKVSLEDKLKSPNFSDKDLLEVHCGTLEEQAAYVNRFVQKVHDPVRIASKPGSSYQFWKFQYSLAPKLVALFCDDDAFMVNNKDVLDWSALSANPNASEFLLSQKVEAIDTHALITKWGAPIQLIQRLHASERISVRDLYCWFRECRVGADRDLLDKTFYGNVMVFDPSGRHRDGTKKVLTSKPAAAPPAPPAPPKPEPPASTEEEQQE